MIPKESKEIGKGRSKSCGLNVRGKELFSV